MDKNSGSGFTRMVQQWFRVCFTSQDDNSSCICSTVNTFERLYEIICNTSGIKSNAVLDYFEDTYIGRVYENGARTVIVHRNVE